MAPPPVGGHGLAVGDWSARVGRHQSVRPYQLPCNVKPFCGKRTACMHSSRSKCTSLPHAAQYTMHTFLHTSVRVMRSHGSACSGARKASPLLYTSCGAPCSRSAGSRRGDQRKAVAQHEHPYVPPQTAAGRRIGSVPALLEAYPSPSGGAAYTGRYAPPAPTPVCPLGI